MVDFARLRRERQQVIPVDPREIFLRLPKAPGFDDLWSSQSDALAQWFERRDEKDVVIKLNTGGGKTLVGLLIAQSIVNERKGPVLYLCPTAQLQRQVVEQSAQYGIPAVNYPTGAGRELPDEFLGANAVMVGTYHALFNGYSKFGISGSPRGSVRLEGIILDDAHTAFSNVRDIYSLCINSDEDEELYNELTAVFRGDFAQQGKQGTFDDVVSSQESFILEIPYTSWTSRAEEVRQRLSGIARDQFPLVWPLVRDSFERCHAFISKDQFVITPFYPLVDLVPSFAECPRRIYMSATVADDSSIVRTFDADGKSVAKAIAPTSLAGVGERMILIPSLTKLPRNSVTRMIGELCRHVSKSSGVVILAPSTHTAKQWSDIATVAVGTDVSKAVACLVSGDNTGPYVFPNRYDGIDLPGPSCRLLLMGGLPRGSNVYDLHRATILDGSGIIDSSLAQRVEQGMGRGTRGGGDHCVVILLGNDLVGWISKTANLELLTNTTQEQVKVGIEVSRDIGSVQDFVDTVNKCFERSTDWTQFHADALADSTARKPVDAAGVAVASTERKYFALFCAGHFGKATNVIENFVRDSTGLDTKLKAWLLDLGARAAHRGGLAQKRDQLQRDAYSLNRGLHRPATAVQYAPLAAPTKQAEKIVAYVQRYALSGGALADFEQIVDFLVPSSTAGQFEEALKQFGEILGFVCDRPERKDEGAPDVLWILGDRLAWSIECKSRKKNRKSVNKNRGRSKSAVI